MERERERERCLVVSVGVRLFRKQRIEKKKKIKRNKIMACWWEEGEKIRNRER